MNNEKNKNSQGKSVETLYKPTNVEVELPKDLRKSGGQQVSVPPYKGVDFIIIDDNGQITIATFEFKTGKFYLDWDGRNRPDENRNRDITKYVTHWLKPVEVEESDFMTPDEIEDFLLEKSGIIKDTIGFERVQNKIIELQLVIAIQKAEISRLESKNMFDVDVLSKEIEMLRRKLINKILNP